MMLINLKVKMKNKNFDSLVNDISKCVGSAILIGDPFKVEKRNAYCISIEKYHELFDLVKELKIHATRSK